MTHILTCYDDLLVRLEHDRIPHRAARDLEQVVLPIDRAGLRSHAVIGWPERPQLAQILVVVPVIVPTAHRRAVAETCVRVDHGIAEPGFCMDLDRGLLYYRRVIPRRPDGSLPAAAIRKLFSAAVHTAARFAPVLVAAASGVPPVEAVGHAA